MLTHIRHIQKGLLIAVTIVIVFAFAFLYSDYDFVKNTLGTRECVFRVYGKCYRLKEAQKLKNTFMVAMRFGMYDFAMDLFGKERLDDDETNFMLSMVILRKEAEKLGIKPSFEEIQEAIPQLPALQNQPWMDDSAVKNLLAANGFTMGDFQDLVSDYLAWKKIKELLSAGIETVPSEIDRLYKDQYQRYDVTVLDVNRNDYIKDVEVTDEAIQKYYDENKENLMSETKRAFEVVRFTQAEQPETATQEEKDRAAQAFGREINDAYGELAEHAEEFLERAKSKQNAVAKNKVEVKELAAFAPSDAPDFLKGEDQILARLFSGALAKGSVTEPFQMKEGGYAVFKISDEIAPEPLTLEQAKEQIVTAIKNSESNSKASDLANEARQKVLDATKAGKSIADAAKEAGLKTRVIPNFSQSEPPAEIDDANVIMRAVTGVPVGDVSPVVPKPNGEGFLLAYVSKIELYEDSSKDSRQNILGSGQDRSDQISLFDAWFNQRRKDAGVERQGRIIPRSS